MIPRGPATRNGTRQPQSSSLSRGTQVFIPVTTDAPSTYPDSVPNSSQDPMNPRRSSGEYSAMKVVAPPYSPPVENPCTIRATTSRMGDQTPIELYDGISPIQRVPMAIMIMVTARTF